MENEEDCSSFRKVTPEQTFFETYVQQHTKTSRANKLGGYRVEPKIWRGREM